MSEYLISIMLGIIEGVTEFLPISSTGHLIIMNQFVDFTGQFAKMFDVVIQFGAILSVVAFFWKRLYPFGKKPSEEKKLIFDIWKKAIVGVIPAMVIGVIAGKYIKEYLFNPYVVSAALVIGGIILIYLENRDKTCTINTITELSYKTALTIGLIQCIAMVPGTSRSAATIIGAMLLGSSRLVAAEYSFFLAIPTMFAASVYSLMKVGRSLTSTELQVLGIGFVVSFITALLVIALFMKYITKNNFKPFGYYRIILGIIVLLYFLIM